MKIIEKFSFCSANYLTLKLKHNHQKRSVLYFGFQAIYGDLIKLIIMALISGMVGSFWTTMLIAFSFAYLRKNAGGIHMKSEWGCILFTTGICVIPGTIVNSFSITSFSLTIFFMIMVLIFCLVCLYKYSPMSSNIGDIPNKSKIAKFKKKSIISLVSLYLLAIGFIFFGQYKSSISIVAGCMLEVFTILPYKRKKTIKLH
ncbi:accessory protein regulator protein B [Ruminiclostridium hungatei]|uniref:Accessory protein regulator protein B n=1 Tax=Ruminiclostridium hungatei TaxID=48256 RepID=A0A1V4SRC0_RUMHU|nr:accessory gene regulator B family protein [Ruminiclostridium hungatei]OPX46333.1 accessory protein regulator protein B [Ruminiclostridium hungatei]